MLYAPTIKTSYGPVSGIVKDGVLRYLGIPYAAPPVGELAFRHPRPPKPWTEVLEATKGGANCIQEKSRFSTGNNSEDCLYLNIFVPQGLGGKLPVMVWIHGGSFATGGIGRKSEDTEVLEYELGDFARETGTVVVSINYRLNLYGFLNLHFLSERFEVNCGLYDQLMAIRFVKDNIEAFGGDPGNITLFGQSAGGESVLSMLASPLSKGFFNKAIVQSPPVNHVRTEEESRIVSLRYMRLLGISPNRVEKVLNVSHSKVARVNRLLLYSTILNGDLRCPFAPVVDGEFLMGKPAESLSKASMPLLIGTAAHEGDLFVSTIPLMGAPIVGDSLRRLSDKITKSDFSRPVSDIVKTYGGPVRQYLFDYITPEMRKSHLRCCHASDLPILLGRPLKGLCTKLDGETLVVRRRMRAIWKEFAYRGLDGDLSGKNKLEIRQL